MTNRASGIKEKNIGSIIESHLHVTGSEDIVTMSVYSFPHIAVLKPVKDS